MSTQNYLFIQVTDEFTDHSSTSGNTKILAASNSRQLRTKPSPFIHGHKRVQHLFTEEAALLGFLEITLHDWDFECPVGLPAHCDALATNRTFLLCLAEFCLSNLVTACTLLCRPSEVARFRDFPWLLTQMEWLVTACYYSVLIPNSQFYVIHACTCVRGNQYKRPACC
jgi:hypothetical protein